jgi:AMMECR1 domain-containing protein
VARTQARPVTALAIPYGVLGRDLRTAERTAIHDHVRALLQWQRTLADWPAPALDATPDATPFVSLYANGVLRGCFGSSEGTPGERLTRAFLRAVEDSRYGSVRATERDRLTVAVSYVRDVRALDPASAPAAIEVGREGLFVLKSGSAPAILLPQVACDARADGPRFVELLRGKAGLADWTGAALFAFTTEDVVVHSDGPAWTILAHNDGARPLRAPRAARSKSPSPDDRGARLALLRGAAWIERLVAKDGSLAFAIDARKRQVVPNGTMHHGRAAVALRALAAVAAEARVPRAVAQGLARAERRARGWLETAVADALRGTPPPGWPADPAMAAGTLALALFAGVGDRTALLALAASRAASAALAAAPWHAAQVVAALGTDAPDSLWQRCVADLAARPWAPWTVVAARARGDAAVVRQAAAALSASIRDAAPHEGGCAVSAVPEVALTAVVVEALAGLPGARARRAVVAAGRFLTRAQLRRESVAAALDPSLADGAFPASPVVTDFLRCDVSGHALLALLALPRTGAAA